MTSVDIWGAIVLADRAVMRLNDEDGNSWVVTIYENPAQDTKYSVDYLINENQYIRTVTPTADPNLVLISTIGDQNYSIERALLLVDLSKPSHVGVAVHFGNLNKLYVIQSKIITNRVANSQYDMVLTRYGFGANPNIDNLNEQGGLYSLNSQDLVDAYIVNPNLISIVMSEPTYKMLYSGTHVFDPWGDVIGRVWRQKQDAIPQPIDPSLDVSIYLPAIVNDVLSHIFSLQKDGSFVKTSTSFSQSADSFQTLGYVAGWDTNINAYTKFGTFMAEGGPLNWYQYTSSTTFGVMELP